MTPQGKGWFLMGHVGVDSGQLIVTDPCYIQHFKNNEASGHPVYRDTVTKRQYRFTYGGECLGPGVRRIPMYSAICPGTDKTFDDLIDSKRLEPVYKELDDSYSYRGCCMVTHARGGGEVGCGINGVAFRSGYGDGRYAVWGRRNADGRIMEVRIFME